MNYYGAADVHSNNTCLGIIDETGKKVFRKKVLNYTKLIINELEPFKPELKGMVVESTFNWYWIVDAMMEAGYKVHLANPAAVKQYEGLKHTNDFDDAYHLANLLRLGILPEGYIYPKEQRAVRDLLRKRLMLVRHRTAHILSFQSLYCRQTGFQLRGSDVQRFRDHELEEISPLEHVQLAGQASILTMRFLASLISKIEKKILPLMIPQPPFMKLKTITGIGDILGLTIALETGDITRFPKVGNYASYCRMVSSQHLSNDKKKGQGNRKNGNKYLCWAFIEAANFATRFCPHAKRFHQRKLAKTKNVVATKALAHKLARAAYFVMRDQVDYDPIKLFG